MRRYRGSDGQRYTDSELWQKLERGEWSVFCWDVDSQLQVVETEGEDLLFLHPTDRAPPAVTGAPEERP